MWIKQNKTIGAEQGLATEDLPAWASVAGGWLGTAPAIISQEEVDDEDFFDDEGSDDLADDLDEEDFDEELEDDGLDEDLDSEDLDADDDDEL